MLEQLNVIERAALESLSAITDQAALDAWRVANVGRSSPLMLVFSGLGKLSKEERPVVGAAANRAKVALESALEERAKVIKEAVLAKSLEEEQLDVTLPGRSINVGRGHEHRAAGFEQRREELREGYHEELQLRAEL